MSLIHYDNEYDTTKIQLDTQKIIKLKNQSMFVPISYNNKTFYIQTPALRIPFELKAYQGKYKLNLSIDKSNDLFLNLLNAIDKQIRTLVSQNQDLLNTLHIDNSFEIINWEKRLVDSGIFVKSFKTDYEYDPLFKCKFKTTKKTGDLAVTYTHPDTEVTPLTLENLHGLLEQNLWISCIIKVKYVWFVNRKFGITYEVIKIREETETINESEDEIDFI